MTSSSTSLIEQHLGHQIKFALQGHESCSLGCHPLLHDFKLGCLQVLPQGRPRSAIGLPNPLDGTCDVRLHIQAQGKRVLAQGGLPQGSWALIEQPDHSLLLELLMLRRHQGSGPTRRHG